MRIAVLDAVYPAFVRSIYTRDPDLAQRPYEEQLRTLLEFSFGTSDAYTDGLRALGHESWNVLTNVLPLQTAWLRRNGLRKLLRAADSLPGRAGNGVRHYVYQAIVAAQVDATDPEVVFVHDSWSMDNWMLRRWRRQGRFLVTQIASVPPPMKRVAQFDLVLSSFEHFVQRFRNAGVDAEFLPLAFHTKVLDRLRALHVDPGPAAERAYPVAFTGGVDPSVYRTTVPMLERAARELPVEMWGYDEEKLPPESPVRTRWHGAVWGIDMYRVLAESKIVLNRHGTIAEGQANNMRLFEATGSGAMLMTDASRLLDELFVIGREVVDYSSADDLVEKARYYLEHDDERVAIARAGQERTLRDHTYGQRMRELDALLQARLSSRISSNQSR